ncbi:hypothetical protein, partial [Escherichia coli]|uniref:hypothetical protein n=1 Tax=Escherichia coli TaxID=562 RepID=UPI0005A8DEC5
ILDFHRVGGGVFGTCNSAFLQGIVFIVFLFLAPQVIHRLVVKFLDLVFKILFLILVLGAKFLIKNKMLQRYR